jgi:hypothetical protein
MPSGDVHCGGFWYYRTREGTVGPFESRAEAEHDCRSACAANEPHPRELLQNLWLLLKRL